MFAALLSFRVVVVGLIVVSLLILFVCGGDGVMASSPRGLCSRRRSREARAILQRDVYPFVDELRYELPDNCPFNRQRDVLGLQETMKKRVRNRQWKCQMCEKTFRDEDWLDAHIQRRHSGREQSSSSSSSSSSRMAAAEAATLISTSASTEHTTKTDDEIIPVDESEATDDDEATETDVDADDASCLADMCNVLGCKPVDHAMERVLLSRLEEAELLYHRALQDGSQRGTLADEDAAEQNDESGHANGSSSSSSNSEGAYPPSLAGSDARATGKPDALPPAAVSMKRAKVPACRPKEMERLKLLCHAIIHKCFPSHLSQDAHKLHDMFIESFCNPLHCDGHGGSTPRSTNQDSETKQRLYYVLVGFLLIVLLVYYVSMWMYRADGVGHSRDVFKARRHGSNFLGIGSSQGKNKLY